MKNKAFYRWEPTGLCRHPDSIVSSDYAHFKPLVPAYMKASAFSTNNKLKEGNVPWDKFYFFLFLRFINILIIG